MRKSGTMTQLLAQYGDLIGRENVGWNGCPCACHNPENNITHEHVCCLPTRGEWDRFKCAVKKIEDEEEREKVEKMIERIDLVFKTNAHISSDLVSLSMGPVIAMEGFGDLTEINPIFSLASSVYGQIDSSMKQRSRRPVIIKDKKEMNSFDALGNFDEGDAFDF